MADPDPRTVPAPHLFPKVPAYAWSWLQRSRPVVAEVAQRLTGAPPAQGFVEELGERFESDAFTRDVVIGVIADVAFNGRIPRHRPVGASWDRGLTWWAAAIAGVTPQAFDAAVAPVQQTRLFGVEESHDPAQRPAAGSRRTAAAQRAMFAAALRELIRTSDGEHVPVASVKALLAQLQEPHSADGPSSQ